ncbi:MAG TPA: transglycosylase SLT domain-containing protein [Candidatus Sulfomarinibacteraceae bacterium]|nr:transglycosylase SLT domain-containing protein [Candidatus Sulfomarinibacteraceae bacterium]
MAYYDQYYTQYAQVQTPFLQIPEHRQRASSNVVQRRMLFILASVLLLIVPLLVSLRPDYGAAAAAASGQEVVAQAGEADAGAGSLSSDAGAEFSAPAPAPGQLSPVFTPEVRHWEPQIVAWASAHGLDPNLVAIIMQIESCGDPNAVSSAGAQGLFQVMPFHFGAGENMQDPDTNASRGLTYFVERLHQTNGDIGKAFAGYNGGHVAAGGSWDQWLPETQRYYVWSTGIYEDIQAGHADSATVQEWLAAGGASLCRQAASRLGL